VAEHEYPPHQPIQASEGENTELLGGAEPPRQHNYPFWGYQDVALFFGLGLPCILIGALLVAGIARLLPPGLQHRTVTLILGQFLGYGMLFLLLYLLLHLHYDRPFWPSLRWVRGGVRPERAIVLGFLVAFGVALMGALLQTPDIETPMKDLVLADRTSLVLVMFFGVTLGPLAEELAFRGFMQPLFVRSFGTVAGILLAAVPFGLLHLQQYAWSWRHGLLVTLAGASFGLMRHVSGSTRAATLMHAAYNSTFFIALLANRKELPTTW
jgi:membrane protease YdiL (CAAX protease family)